MASAIGLQAPAGRLADKLGRKKVFFMLDVFYCLGIIVLIVAPSPEYLVLYGVLGSGLGGIGGVSFTPLITMWWESFPTKNRGKIYGLEGIILSSSRIPLTLLGGFMWDQGLKAQIFLMSLLAEFLVVVPLIYSIPETLKQD